jgi:hypothetical protein
LDELTWVLHTCTGPVDRPPVMVAVKLCAAVASIVSMTVDHVFALGERSVT